MSINLIVLVGNAGRDPELRFFESGSCVCEFTLAVNRPPRDGQNQEPLWVNCKAWGKTAQVAGDYLRERVPNFRPSAVRAGRSPPPCG